MNCYDIINSWIYINILISFRIINGIILNNCSDNIYPNTGDTVICTNNCNECNIYCTLIDQCKSEIYVYSGSFNTNIYCTNDNSCEGSIFYLGNNMDYNIPNNYSINQFIGEYQSVNVYCNGHTSCKGTNFNIFGNYSNGVMINVTGDDINEDIFQDSILNCNLNDGQNCTLICGDNENNCGNVMFECYGDICECIGNGCDSLIDGGISMQSSDILIPIYI